MADNKQITGGPSREALFDALSLRHEGRTVSFTLGDTLLLEHVRVNGIAIEDGSGNNWSLELYDSRRVFGVTHLSAYFNTTRRQGWVRPMVP